MSHGTVIQQLLARAPMGLLAPTRTPGSATAESAESEPIPTLLDVLDLGDGRVLAVVSESSAVWTLPLVVEAGRARRAVAGDGVSAALVSLMARRPGGHGAFELEGLHAGDVHGETALEVDQTNESVIVGGEAVIKWLQPAAQDAPAPARIAVLDRSGFAAMPSPWGFVWWGEGPGRFLLATVAGYLADATDGWTWCVDDVRRFAVGGGSLAAAIEPARAAGRIVAGLHLSLGGGSSVYAGAELVARWVGDANDSLDRALSLVTGSARDRLLTRAPTMREAFAAIERVVAPRLIPVHGDLHVGQLLKHRDAGGTWAYALTDFDGNPVVAAAQRNVAQPAARDVAGYLQSLDHVGRVVVRHTEGVDGDAVRRWTYAAQQQFLAAYRATLPTGCDLLCEGLLRPFQVEQECRELVYAATHLPHWAYVPDAALTDLVPMPDDESP